MGEGAWIFRVASAPEVGGGHVARCLTLARRLLPLRHVHFVLDRGGERWAERIGAEGMGVSFEGDELALGQPVAGCLLDGYRFTEADRRAWKRRCGRLAQIDDFGTATEIVDLIIAPGLHRVPAALDGDPRLLAGARYALLDPCYAELPGIDGGDEVHTILLACGLRDSANLTGLAVAALREIGFRGKAVVAIGGDAPHLESLRRQAAEASPFELELLTDADDVCRLMAGVQLVIGAGGVSLFERMAAGRPSLTAIAAENQRLQVEWAASLGGTEGLGEVAALTVGGLAQRLAPLLADADRRHTLSSRGRAAVDGRGGERIAAILGGLPPLPAGERDEY